jgi:hypothetical protein
MAGFMDRDDSRRFFAQSGYIETGFAFRKAVFL